jgi:LAS superfamily LD-carboxypeptidase LdcB
MAVTISCSTLTYPTACEAHHGARYNDYLERYRAKKSEG